MLVQPNDAGFEAITRLLEKHTQRVQSLRAESDKQKKDLQTQADELTAALNKANHSGTIAEEVAAVQAMLQVNKSKDELNKILLFLQTHDVNSAKVLVYGAVTWHKIEKQLEEFVRQGKVDPDAVHVFKSCFNNLWTALLDPETTLVPLEKLVNEFYRANPITSDLTQVESYNELWYAMMIVMDSMCLLTISTILLATLDLNSFGLASLTFNWLALIYNLYQFNSISFTYTEAAKDITDLKNVAEFYQEAMAPLAKRRVTSVECLASGDFDSQHSQYTASKQAGSSAWFFLPANFNCQQALQTLAEEVGDPHLSSFYPV